MSWSLGKVPLVGGTWDHGTFGRIDEFDGGGLRSLPPDVRLLARGAYTYSARNFWDKLSQIEAVV